MVIGAGVAGAATAFGLVRRGIEVTLIDAGRDGRATDAGAGIIQPWSIRRDGEFYRLYADGAAFYPAFVSALAEQGVTGVGYRRVGSLVVSASPLELDEVEARLASRAADAPAMGEVRRLPRGQAATYFPPLDPALSAVWIPGGGRVDGRLLREGLLAAVRALGGRLHPAAARLEPAGGGARVVAGGTAALGDGDALDADGIVVAAGAWTNEVLAPLGLSAPVEAQKGQIMHLRVRADTTRWPVVHPLGSTHYLLAFDEGRIVAGATREFGSGFDTRVTPAGMQELLHNALEVAPGLIESGLIELRAGLRPLSMSSTQLPAVERLTLGGSVPLWVNAGFGAAGLTMGPLVGDRLAAEIASAL